MLYEALFTVELPRALGAPLPTPPWDGLNRWLFTGTWRRRTAHCSVSGAGALAGCFAAVRTVAEGARWTVTDDAGELFALQVAPDGWGAAPGPWAESLPPGWTEAPCAFRAEATWDEGGFTVAAVLRYTPTHPAELAPLSGAARVMWRPEATGERLAARLDGGGSVNELARRLRLQGDRVACALTDALGERFGAASSHRARVVLLAGDGFGELLRGFPPE
ncbi:MAG: hypothetical protein ABMA64_06750, partial [Myxococcota bacterium]